MMILVAGSCEAIKCQTCFILASQGISIRALINPHASWKWVDCLKNYGATLAVGDLQDPGFLSDLYLDVNAVICSPISIQPEYSGDLPVWIDLKGMLQLINGAKTAEVHQFVYLSIEGTGKEPAAQGNVVQIIEQQIIDSGVPYTILQVDSGLALVNDFRQWSSSQPGVIELARLATQALDDPSKRNAILQLNVHSAR